MVGFCMLVRGYPKVFCHQWPQLWHCDKEKLLYSILAKPGWFRGTLQIYMNKTKSEKIRHSTSPPKRQIGSEWGWSILKWLLFLLSIVGVWLSKSLKWAQTKALKVQEFGKKGGMNNKIFLEKYWNIRKIFKTALHWILFQPLTKLLSVPKWLKACILE